MVNFILQHVIIQGSQGRNSKQEIGAGAGTEDTEECCLLTCSSWLAQSAFLQYQDDQLRGGTAHGWVLPHIHES